MNNRLYLIIYILLLLGAATPAIAQTIKGNVYGGGNLAQVVGSTTVNIIDGTVSDQNVDDGNVYGGGSFGSVEGDTNVKILGGIINGNIFGAGMGEAGHPDKAKVTGDTNVTVGQQP